MRQPTDRVSASSAETSSASAAAVRAAVDAEIDARITGGELVKKDLVTSLCSAAKEEGMTLGETKVRTEISQSVEKEKIITARKALLTTNSVPLPKEDAAMEGDDAAFEARRLTAVSRMDVLKGMKVSLNSALMPSIWGDEKDFKIVENAVTLMRAESGGSPVAEPFSKPPEASTGARSASFLL